MTYEQRSASSRAAGCTPCILVGHEWGANRIPGTLPLSVALMWGCEKRTLVTQRWIKVKPTKLSSVTL